MSSGPMSSEPMTQGLTKSRFRHWALVVLTLLAFGRGIWALGGKSLWWDESLSYHRSVGDLITVFSNQIVLTDNVTEVITIDNHPPLYFLLLWISLRLFGHTEFALRFLSLTAVVLVVPLLYATGRRLVDRRTGFIAAALGALSPMYLWYGQEARMYAMLAFWSLLSFCLFVHTFFRSGKPLPNRRQWYWVGAYIFASACVLFTHYLSSLLIAFELLVLGVIFLRRIGSRRVLALTILALLGISLSLLAQALLNIDRMPGNRAGFRFVPLLILLRDLLNSFSLGLSVDVGHWYVLLIDLVFLVFLLLGLARLMRSDPPGDHRAAGWLLLGYLLIPIVLIYLLSYVQPAYMNSRHLILVTPAFYLLVAAGLAWWRRGAAGFALLGSLLMAGGMSYSIYNYFYDPAYDKDHHRDWGAYLREHVRPGDVVVVDPPHIAELYEYYADSGVPWIGLPLLNASRQETYRTLEGLFQEYDRVWLAFSHTPPWGDRRRLPEKWLDENAFRVDYQPFESYASNVLVACYLRGWPSVSYLPDDAHSVEVRYSPSLRLAGYRLVSDAQPGKRLHVQLFWAVDELGPEQASLVLRLVDDQGHLWGWGEQCPFNGLYPMWQWQPGLILRDEHHLALQPGIPPGTYQLEVRLIGRPTEDGCSGAPGEPIWPASTPPQAGRGDSVFLGEVEVGRSHTSAAVNDLGIEHRRRVRFDGLEFLGESLAPAELKPGERLSVALYWQARRASLPDARFRLRLVDSSGKAWQEMVIHPAGNTYPTSRWLAGDRYEGQFWLQLPESAPPGRYRVELVPESPLQRTGMMAVLRRWFGLGESALSLGSIEVQALPPPPSVVPTSAIPLPSDLSVPHPMVAVLGDQVRFLGYDIESEALRSGEELEFTLYWQALRPMNISYSVFTHLLGPSDEILGQKDDLPQGGAYPTTLWQPGEVIVDSYAFTVDPDVPAGLYPLEVGMYRLESGTRLSVSDADGRPVPYDRILLPPIRVLPALTPTPAPPVEWHRLYLPLVESWR